MARPRKDAEEISFTEKNHAHKAINTEVDVRAFLNETIKYERSERKNLEAKIKLQDTLIEKLRSDLAQNTEPSHKVWADLIKEVIPIAKSQLMGSKPLFSIGSTEDEKAHMIKFLNIWQDADALFLRNLENVSIFASFKPQEFAEMAENLDILIKENKNA